ncbi:MAG: 4-hydroxy-tetrahydrodipicolinate reductase [Candidatus Omnitrophica bacterium]|nr:4-hydroxy-tetrahydrodipicolinate reductase [Candidatus Omnitrophota bacterium]
MKKERIPVVISGACGRLGTVLRNLVIEAEDLLLVGAVEHPSHVLQGKMIEEGVILTSVLPAGKYVVVDFSTPEATSQRVAEAVRLGNPMVIGTTGLNEERMEEIRSAAKLIPIVYGANMSFAVNCFFEIVRRAAELLRGYEVEIVETHHHFKKDAPSGTAKELARIICEVKEVSPEKNLRFGREGVTGERLPEEIGIHALRLGDVVGEHTVIFGKKGELVELVHRCYDRSAFAAGALDAARFVWRVPPGIYSMSEVISGKKKGETL